MEETAMYTEYKQIIIMLKSLKMGKGKLVSQGSHASVGSLIVDMEENETHFLIPKTPANVAWLNGSFTKITVSVDTLEELEAIYEEAKKRGLPTIKITDNGRTTFNGVPTVTAVGIGPAHISDLDFTKHLKLLN